MEEGLLGDSGCFPGGGTEAQRGHRPDPGSHSRNPHASPTPSPLSVPIKGSKIIFHPKVDILVAVQGVKLVTNWGTEH